MAINNFVTLCSNDTVSREHAHVNKWLGMDKKPAESCTHKNTDVQPVPALPQCPKPSTDTDITGIMNLIPFRAKLRLYF